LQQGGDAAEGSGIEVCSADDSAQSTEEFFSPSFLSYQDGLSWHLCALKTKKRSVAFKLFAAIDLYSVLVTKFENIGKMWLLPQKWSS